MAAALTIAVLFAVSITIVRAAAVAMRLTGLPEAVARFQCLSALTGTGFTTSESEMIVNYPLRRRILATLMIFGNLGLVSVAATFIVAFVDAGRDAVAIWGQVFAIAVAIGVILLMALNKTLDGLMCRLMGTVLQKTTSLGRRRYQRTLQLDADHSIAEHRFVGDEEQRIADRPFGEIPLMLIAVRSDKTRGLEQISEDLVISPGDTLVCYGSETAHDMLEDRMSQTDTANISAP